MNKSEIYAALAELVDYDPETGIFVWKYREGITVGVKVFNARFAGRECLRVDNQGYREIRFMREGERHKISAHRLAWMIVHGKLPDGEIDHINRNRTDNRIANLRDVPHAINQRNLSIRKDNTSGITGVSWHKASGKWQAQASVDGRNLNLGLFHCIREADSAIKVFRSKHGFTNTHGSASNAKRD